MSATIPVPSTVVQTLTERLAAPFALTEVKFKPQAVKGNKALALAYIDARVIQDRLDRVLGVDGWKDEYDLLPDGAVVCRLHLRLGEHWITKMDVGSESEQPDAGDRHKAAFSDALKRAAVKFGVGRYLYRLPLLWADYDPLKKQFVRPPMLPTWAMPVAVADVPKVKAAPPSAPSGKPANLPTDGKELRRRLQEYDAKLAEQGLCVPGELVQWVTQAGVKAGHGADLTAWTATAMALAVEQTKAFETSKRQPVSEKAVA